MCQVGQVLAWGLFCFEAMLENGWDLEINYKKVLNNKL
jgi:hypothetical protein